jgi:hypothetical protein
LRIIHLIEEGPWRYVMRNRIFGLFLFIALIVLCMPVFSQEAGQNGKPDASKQNEEQERQEMRQREPSKLWVDLSGLMYAQWGYFTGFNNSAGNAWSKVARWGIDDTAYPTLIGVAPTDYSYKNSNTFSLQRAYLTLRKEIGDIFSVKVTSDINTTGSNKGSDYLFLKYGFIQLYKEFVTPYGPLFVKAQGGKIATPVIGITDWLSDLRWIGESFLGGSRFVLNGKSFDNSADLGGLLSMGLFDLLKFEYTFTNGEGYLRDNDETYAGKAHTLMVSINPGYYRLKELFINFYGRWEDTNENNIDTSNLSDIPGMGYVIKYSGIDKRSYLGFGAAWHSEPVKIGVNFFLPQQRVSRSLYLPIIGPSTPVMWYVPGHTLHFYFNLGALVKPATVLLIAKCGYGKELKNLLGNQRQSHETLVVGAGIGWQFSRYFRLAAYYEQVRYHMGTWYNDFTKKDPAANNNIYVKLEVKY